jgi:hypothetical protein
VSGTTTEGCPRCEHSVSLHKSAGCIALIRTSDVRIVGNAISAELRECGCTVRNTLMPGRAT